MKTESRIANIREVSEFTLTMHLMKALEYAKKKALEDVLSEHQEFQASLRRFEDDLLNGYGISKPIGVFQDKEVD